MCFHCLLSCVFCLQVFSCKDASALCALCLTWITGLGSSTAALHPRDLSSWAQLDLLIHLRLQRQYHYTISFLLSKDTTRGKLTALGWNLKRKDLCCFELWKRLCCCHTVEYRQYRQYRATSLFNDHCNMASSRWSSNKDCSTSQIQKEDLYTAEHALQTTVMSIRWEQGQLELTARLRWSTGFSGGRGATGETARNRHGKTRDELVSTRRTISPASLNYKRDLKQAAGSSHTHCQAQTCIMLPCEFRMVISRGITMCSFYWFDGII